MEETSEEDEDENIFLKELAEKFKKLEWFMHINLWDFVEDEYKIPSFELIYVQNLDISLNEEVLRSYLEEIYQKIRKH